MHRRLLQSSFLRTLSFACAHQASPLPAPASGRGRLGGGESESPGSGLDSLQSPGSSAPVPVPTSTTGAVPQKLAGYNRGKEAVADVIQCRASISKQASGCLRYALFKKPLE